jgi:uncharacterized membrane protein YedE/YeeE
VAFIGFRFVLRRPRPVLDDIFHLPTRHVVDPALVAGAALFGIGWGISGYCPGPAIALLAAPGREALIFLPAMVLGIVLHRWLRGAGRGDAEGNTRDHAAAD